MKVLAEKVAQLGKYGQASVAFTSEAKVKVT